MMAIAQHRRKRGDGCVSVCVCVHAVGIAYTSGDTRARASYQDNMEEARKSYA
jgi:hypothetical protein